MCVCIRGLHGPGPVPGPARGPGRAGEWGMIFTTGRAGPANEGWFLQRAGLGRQIRDDFSNGPGRQIRDDFSNGPGRAGKKRIGFFKRWVGLQKKEDE